MVAVVVVVEVGNVPLVDGVAVLLNVAVVGEVELVCKMEEVEEKVRVVTAVADVDVTEIANGFAVETKLGSSWHVLLLFTKTQDVSARQSRGLRLRQRPSSPPPLVVGRGVVVKAAVACALAVQLLLSLLNLQPSLTLQSRGTSPPQMPTPPPSCSLPLSPSPPSSLSPAASFFAAQLLEELSNAHVASCLHSDGASPLHPVAGASGSTSSPPRPLELQDLLDFSKEHDGLARQSEGESEVQLFELSAFPFWSAALALLSSPAPPLALQVLVVPSNAHADCARQSLLETPAHTSRGVVLWLPPPPMHVFEDFS